ncbi:MAG: prolyl oligopeptidase family serine peptidase [Usitatibacter sp.]
MARIVLAGVVLAAVLARAAEPVDAVPAPAVAAPVAPAPIAPAPIVEDPFAFLEDESSPRTQSFYRDQAAKARAAFDRIPGRAAMLARIRELSGAQTTVSAIAVTTTRVFYLKIGPRQSTPSLYMRDGLMGPEKLVLDPERFARGSTPAAIDWFVPSPDGRHVAYGVSPGGNEDSVLRVLAADTRRDLPFEIDRARFNRELAWQPDSRAFYYARVPEANTGIRRDANVRIYRHVLGRDTARDEIVFAPGVGGARDVPEFVYPSLHVPLESRYAYAIVRDGVRREIAVHVTEQKDLAAGKPRWHKLAGVDDEILAIEGWKDDLYLLSKRSAPHHRVLRVKANSRDLSAARLAVPEGDAIIEAMALAKDAIYLRTMLGGIDRLERHNIGWFGIQPSEFVKIPFDYAITQLAAHPRASGAILRLQGWIEPPRVVQVEAKSGNLRNTQLQPPPVADQSAMDEVRLYAPSHDGTRIPVTLIYKKTTRLDGNNPTLLIGYGAYGISMTATFDPTRLAWLERGGILAIAHVRGGGEYGEAWREAGRRNTKVNTILDFIAVSEFLASYGFTNPKRLAIQGTSAGGIPAGGALVRRPELFAAVVARVPVMDMLRFEMSPDGPANVPEFGSAATPEGARALRVMSAYHHVKDATAYPAVLLTAAINDPRVAAWQPGKMAGRLQAATNSGKPVLLRVDFESGHGIGTSRNLREEELADIYSFLLWQMGDPQFQPPAPAPRAEPLEGPPEPAPAGAATVPETAPPPDPVAPKPGQALPSPH